MAHFAKVEDGIVTQVLVIDQETLNTGLWGDPSLWIQTSYNTRRGVHYIPGTDTPSGQPHVRGNYAGIGYTYDKDNDVFLPPKPYDSFILNETTWTWEAPIAKPVSEEGDLWVWSETNHAWENTIPAPSANTSANTANTAG
jgi:hypothetical protein